jgi:hypothetical protein
MNWGEHERDCALEWEANWFDHAQRKDTRTGKDARRVKTANHVTPPAIAEFMAALLMKNATYVRADAFACPEHGAWVSFIIGIPAESRDRVLHFSMSREGAESKDRLWATFREACMVEGARVTVEQVGKILKHFPAIAAAALRGSAGMDALGRALADAGLTAEDVDLDHLAGEEPPQRPQDGRDGSGV